MLPNFCTCCAVINESDRSQQRVRMDFHEEQNGFPGLVPSSGAIFMSNGATKKECLRRGLLGLPWTQANFVKQVKAGMVLFLFEFEKRQLHGVFQATSDGALNIMPGAFRSTGKQFPAQVKFIPLWNCSPLYEDEFRDAIRENYFSSNKFNFGLSERQVRRLLVLFSSRKLNNKSLQRQLNHGKVRQSVQDCMKKSGTASDGGSFAMIGTEKDDAEDGFGSSIFSTFIGKQTSCYKRISDDVNHASHVARNAHNVNGLLIPDEHVRDSRSEIEKLVDGGWFVTRDSRNRDADIEPRSVITNYSKHPLDSSKRTLDDVSFASSSQLGDRYNDDCHFRPRVSTGFSDSFLSNSPVYSRKPIPEAESPINDQFRPFLLEPPVSTESSGSFLSKFPFSYGKTILEANSLMNEQFEQPSAVDQLLCPNEPVHHFSSSCGDAMRLSSNVYPLTLESLSNSRTSASEHLYCVSESPSNSIYPEFDSQPFSSYSEPKGSSRCSETTAHENLARSTPHYELDVHNRQSLALGHPKGPSNYLNVTAHENLDTSTLQYKLDVRSRRSLTDGHPYCTSRSPCGSACPEFDGPAFSFNAGPRDSSRCTDTNSPLGYDFPSSYHSHEQMNGSGQALPKALYPNCRARISSGNKMADAVPCSFPSNLDTSCTRQLDYRCQTSSGKKYNHELSQYKENEAFVWGNPEEGRARSVDHDNDKHNRSMSVRSNSCKSRCSVFSRLASLPSESEEDANDLDSSVDDVMAMLHRSHYQWVKAKNVKQPIKKRDKVADFRTDKEIASSCKLAKCPLPNISEKLLMNNIPDGEENGTRGAEGLPFLDFKRRSKVRKPNYGANARDNIDTGENAGLLVGQQKRRKLIRPKFRDNELVMVGDQDNEPKVQQNIELSDVVCGKEMAKGCVVSFGDADEDMRGTSHDACFQKVCQNIQLSEDSLHIDSESMDARRQLTVDGEEMAGSRMTTFPNSEEGHKEALQDAGIQKAPPSACCLQEINAGEVLHLKNYESDGLSKQQRNCDSSSLKESCSESGVENLEIGEGCGVLNHIDGEGNLYDIDVQGRLLPVNGGIVMNIKENSQITYSPEAEASKASTELGQSEGYRNRLALETDAERCEGSFDTANSSTANLSHETYEENTMRAVVVAVSAKKGHNIDLEQEIDGGNHILPGSCKVASEQTEVFASNLCLASFQNLVNVGSEGEGKEKEMQRVESVDRGFDLNLCNQNDDF